MTQSITLVRVRPREFIEDQKDAPPDAARLLKQSPEDLHLANRIGSALRGTGYRALCAIEVLVNAGIVHLMGRVPSYYLKQIAQETALAIPGSHQIHNCLNVTPPNRDPIGR